jgi:hypothetical protein
VLEGAPAKIAFKGQRVGRTTKDFSERAANLSATLFDRMQQRAASDDDRLAWDFIEGNDAYSYIVLGDPAVKLRG